MVKMTDYHAKYIAHELTLRCASDSVEKLTAVQAHDAARRDVDWQKDALLDEINQRLEQKAECSELFALPWRGI
jgi:hypothetical protein